MRIRARHVAAAVTVIAAATMTSSPALAAAPTELCFAKSPTGPGTWSGTYAVAAADGSCDATGGLLMTSALTSAPRQSGDVLHITIVWRFYDAGNQLVLETEQKGILSLRTGDVVLNGKVTQGDPLGARTHDRGSPTDANGSYAGVMRVM